MSSSSIIWAHHPNNTHTCSQKMFLTNIWAGKTKTDHDLIQGAYFLEYTYIMWAVFDNFGGQKPKNYAAIQFNYHLSRFMKFRIGSDHMCSSHQSLEGAALTIDSMSLSSSSLPDVSLLSAVTLSHRPPLSLEVLDVHNRAQKSVSPDIRRVLQVWR